MEQQLNNPMVQWLMKAAYSALGKWVRMGINSLLAANFVVQTFPDGDLTQINAGLQSGAAALLAVGWGLFDAWLMKRFKMGVKVMQVSANSGGASTKIDGIPGNSAVNAVAAASGVDASVAVSAVK